MTLSDDDLALVSAFHDGELDPPTTRRMRARLRDEPALRNALDEVREVSGALRALRPPQVAESVPAAGLGTPLKAALAASVVLALALGIGGLLYDGRTPAPATPVEWHSHFVAQSYGADGVLRPAAATQWIGREPDLSAANLTLVDIANHTSGGVFLHYSGLNGCRLTFGTHGAAPALPQPTSDFLAVGWAVGEVHFSVLAVGMDAGRFRAIAALLKQETRRDLPGQKLYAQVRQARIPTVPCA